MDEQEYLNILNGAQPSWSADGAFSLSQNPAKPLLPPAAFPPRPGPMMVTTPRQTQVSSQPASVAASVAGSSAKDKWFPYQVVDATEDSETLMAMVVDDSKFFKSFSDELSVSGLGVGFEIAANNKIWLEIAVATDTGGGMVPDTATIVCDADWEDYPNPVAIDTTGAAPVQTAYYKLIAEVVDASSDTRDGLVIGNLKVIQYLSSQLISTLWAVNGTVCVVPEEMSI